MALPIGLDELDPPRSGLGGGLAPGLGLACLLLALSLASALRDRSDLHRELGAARPRPSALVRALGSEDTRLASAALARLCELSPDQVAAVLAATPLGRGLPVDRLAVPVLSARGDVAARRGLERIRSP